MIQCQFIRHGKTLSNAERRYIDDPEEPLSDEGRQAARALRESGALPPADALMSGPALRCCQTAELLFPGKPYAICPLGEIDFGIFKGKNADELLGDKDYEAWLETGCMGDIPGGDSVTAFKERTCATFLRIAELNDTRTIAFVIHGGNIMAILERFALPKRDFYDYHVPNCGFILCRWDNGALTVEEASI